MVAVQVPPVRDGMTRAFECPKCGGYTELPPNARSGETYRCAYCHTLVRLRNYLGEEEEFEVKIE